MARTLTFAQAINEALFQAMEIDKSVICYGLGVPDPKGVFGTTLGLQEQFGEDRVFDMPASESAMTGVAIGASLNGIRPVMTHQRVDFSLLAMDQLVNNAAKWHYMFGGQTSVPITIRLIIGRGWGQGPTHSQSLQAWFAHVPGLKVVMPTTPYDAKGLLISSIEDNNPVIFVEHRWLYNIPDKVPDGIYRVPLGKANVVREGKDITIASTSYMTLEALRAGEMLAKDGISAEVIDIRTLKPLDQELILKSVCKTGRIVVADTGWKTVGFSAEIIATIAEKALSDLKSPPERVALPDCPTPTSPALAKYYYPRAVHLVATARKMLGLSTDELDEKDAISIPLDVPDMSFTGPF